MNCRLVHTAKAMATSNGASVLWIGSFVQPCWVRLESSEADLETLQSLVKQISATHSQHRRHQVSAKVSSIDSQESFEVIGSDDVDEKVSSSWRKCEINARHSICPTYPRTLLVPSSISDAVIRHAAHHRVKHRLPILSYQHTDQTGPVLIRSGQPLVGLRRNRSIQDEHLISAFRTLNGTIPERQMLIIDARPTVNALANTLVGAGFEPLEWYEGCSRSFVNLENIHHIRSAFLRLSVDSSTWLGHTKRLLTATKTIVEAMQDHGESVLVHCSDGWDRTSQLVSLAKVCLNARYRTVSGLRELVQEDWLDAGHRFSERLAHSRPLINALSFILPPDTSLDSPSPADSLSSWLSALTTPKCKDTDLSHWCPIFPQFVDCLAHLIRGRESCFEYGAVELQLVYRECMENGMGVFAGNCQADRVVGQPGDWNAMLLWGSHDSTPIDTSVIIPNMNDITTMF